MFTILFAAYSKNKNICAKCSRPIKLLLEKVFILGLIFYIEFGI